MLRNILFVFILLSFIGCNRSGLRSLNNGVGQPVSHVKECRVGKSVYALWDNTGTSWNADYTFEVTFDDGSTELASQPAITSGTWTGQLNYWASADGFGTNEDCIYEPSCNILPNGCGGLNPPPTEVIESGTDISKMRWRYLNVKCCFTEKIPVKIEVVTSTIASHVGRVLDLIVFYGEEIEYEVCGACGEDGQWYYYDTKEPVAEQDMPICTRPCGFTFPSLTAPSCSFTYFDGCDQNNIINGSPKAIIIQYVDCGDGEIVNAIFEVDNDGALIDYTPVEVGGEINIDDCNGGVIEEPEPQPLEINQRTAVCIDCVPHWIVDYSDGTIDTIQETVLDDWCMCSTCDSDCEETIWTLYSKLSAPHPQFANATVIGVVDSGTHPVSNFAIDGWTVYQLCSIDTPTPNPDSNGHEWINSSDLSTVTITNPNPSPNCCQ